MRLRFWLGHRLPLGFWGGVSFSPTHRRHVERLQPGEFYELPNGRKIMKKDGGRFVILRKGKTPR